MRFSIEKQAPKAKIIQVVKEFRMVYFKDPYKGKECRVMQLLFDNGEMITITFIFMVRIKVIAFGKNIGFK